MIFAGHFLLRNIEIVIEWRSGTRKIPTELFKLQRSVALADVVWKGTTH